LLNLFSFFFFRTKSDCELTSLLSSIYVLNK